MPLKGQAFVTASFERKRLKKAFQELPFRVPNMY
jgi:hypothetical protein